MSKLFLSFLLAIIGSLIYISSYLIDYKTKELELLNKNKRGQVAYLNQVKETNKWLHENENKFIYKIEKEQEAKEKMINFFDNNRNYFNLTINKYFYKETNTLNLKIDFFVKNETDLQKILNIKFENGYVVFSELVSKKGVVYGTFILSQPIEVKNEK